MIQRDLIEDPVRLLAVRQPWASLLVLGHKPVENRPWGTDYRGRVAILASQNVDTDLRARQAWQEYLAQGGAAGPATCADGIKALPRGGVIGSVELYDVTEGMDSWWFSGPVGLLMRNAVALPHLIPHKGQLGLVQCPTRIAKAIKDSL